MSHFAVMVIGDDIHKQLEPFDENTEVEKYVSHEVSEEDKQQFIDHYIKKGKHKDEFEKMYERHGDRWNSKRWEKNEDGVWVEYSEYNPESKWDWYELGGRFSGMIKLKDGAKGEKGRPGVFDNKVGIDRAKKKDIANFDELKTFAYLKDGAWVERAQMGWWGTTSNEANKDEWLREEAELKASIGDDEWINIVDCHI